MPQAKVGYCLTEHGKAEVVKHLPIVRYVVVNQGRKWAVIYNLHDDLMQAGMEGLIDAVAHFNPNRECKFRSYCERRIWGSCQDFLRTRQSMTPHRDGRKVKKDDRPHVHSMFPTFAPGTDEFVVAYMSGGPEHFGFPPSPLPPVGSELESSDNFEAWASGLCEDERYLVRHYYSETPRTFKQIGEALGKTESRASQMHAAILDRLRYKAAFPKYRELAIA